MIKRGAEYDAVIVGGGPNGLAAAITLAREGQSVLLREARDEIGGAAKSQALTLPGFSHDTFSAVYPMGVGSPFFRDLPLAGHGLEWIHPPAPVAHPFDDGTAAVLRRSLDHTAASLGDDAGAYRKIFADPAGHWSELAEVFLAPPRLPRHPIIAAKFGRHAIRSAEGLARSAFNGRDARALFAGTAAHSGLPLDRKASAAFGIVLNAAGHAVGWPFPRGGAGAITRALAAHLRSLGGEIQLGAPVRSLDELPAARAVLLNLTPRQILSVAGDYLPNRYQRRLRGFRYGAGVFKVDWALSGPVPWAAPGCEHAGTLHLGGDLDEIADSERRPWLGEVAERPFVLFVQPSRFDATRAPPGKHTAWAYCHVPNGCTTDMTDRIEAQVERFAPGFRDLIIARASLSPRDLERLDENLVGGDVNGGAPVLGQLLLRPVARWNPYTTPMDGVFICSASTPPGGAVHGMCGWHAAQSALKYLTR